MKEFQGVEVEFHAILIWALDGGARSAFLAGERVSVPTGVGGWIGSMASLDVSKGRISCTCQQSNPTIRLASSIWDNTRLSSSSFHMFLRPTLKALAYACRDGGKTQIFRARFELWTRHPNDFELLALAFLQQSAAGIDKSTQIV
jgi:hypothetical protein